MATTFAVFCVLALPVLLVSSQNSERSFYVNDFAVDFYCKLATVHNESQNLFFSPLGIYIALGMLKAGAKSTTERQIEKALRWQKFIEGYGSKHGDEGIERLLSNVFAPLRPNNTLCFANKLWVQEYFCTVRCNDYVNRLAKSFDADLEELNFIKHAEKSRKEMNEWVAEKTNQKIRELLTQENVDLRSRLFLTNAVYFKSLWEYGFDKKQTTMQDFTKYVGDGYQKVKVPMMHQEGVFRAYQTFVTPPYDLLDIPIVGEMSMVVVVPKTSLTFRRIQKNLTFADIDEMFQELHLNPASYNDIYLPRFRISHQLDLKSSLKNMMGIKDIFSQQSADLSGITGYRGLFVSDAIHRAVIDVNEDGARAGSAPDFGGQPKSERPLRVDKPFIFLIRHKPTNTILFMGCVMDPLA